MKGVHHQVTKIDRLKDLGLRERLNFEQIS